MEVCGEDYLSIFADDTLLFCEPSERALLNVRCILSSFLVNISYFREKNFQVVSGFNINLAKSELIRL